MLDTCCPERRLASLPINVSANRSRRCLGNRNASGSELGTASVASTKLHGVPACSRQSHISPPVFAGNHPHLSSLEETDSAVVSFHAHHAAWQGAFYLLDNGIFLGGGGKPPVRWEFAGDWETLLINWFDWPQDVLQKNRVSLCQCRSPAGIYFIETKLFRRSGMRIILLAV